MYDDTYMYAIERSPEYLAHYGVRGMRWGVRRALKSGNERRLNRQFNRAQKKLDKLVKQSQNAAKYRKRAIRMGIGAAAAGGLAAAGTQGVSYGISKLGSGIVKGSSAAGKALMNVRGSNPVAHRLRNAGVALSRVGERRGDFAKGMAGAAKSVADWGRSNSLAKQGVNALGGLERANQGAAKALMNVRGNSGLAAGMRNAGVNLSKGSTQTLGNAAKGLYGVSNNTIARIGAGAIGAGLAAGAARNAYKAATAQKREAKFRSEMQKAFKGTKYANQISGGQNRSSQPRQGKKRRRNG